jgi:cellulose synthase operon protein C
MRQAQITILLVAVGVALFSAPASAAEGPPVASQRLESLLTELAAADGWRALAHARRLARPAAYLHPLKTRALYLETADKLEARPTLERRFAAAYLRQRAARFDQELGDNDAARVRLGELGFVQDWSIVGPFENGNNAGFDATYAPEGGAAIDKHAAYDGKVGEVRWRTLGLNLRGYNAVASAVNPDRSVVVYAAAVVRSPVKQEVVLRVGADGAYKIWHGSVLAGSVDKDLGAALDRDAWGVELRKGDNLLLVKLAVENRGKMGFYLRVTDRAGVPVRLDTRPAAAGEGAGSTPQYMHKVFTAVAPPAAAVAAATKLRRDPEAYVDAAFLSKVLRPLDPATPWRDLADKAVDLEPDDPQILALAADVQPEHWRRLELLQAAAATGPDDPWLLTELARSVRANMGVGDVPSVLEMTASASKYAGADAVVPALVHASVLTGEGRSPQALELLEPLLIKWPGCVPLLERVAGLRSRVEDEAGRGRAALALADLRRASTSPTVDAARIELRRGDKDKALARLSALLLVRPDSFVAHQLLARTLDQMGRSDDAIAALDKALVLSPGLVGLLEERGRLQESRGDDDGAISSYELALNVAPERRDIAEKVRALRPDTKSFEAAFRWDQSILVPREGAAELHKGQDYYFIGRQQVVKVAPSGRSTRFTQDVVHVLTDSGAKDWSWRRMYYSPGFERIEVASVRVRKADGTESEAYRRSDYDAGSGSGNLYYLRRYAYVEVPPLEVGDVVEYAYFETEIGDDNFREGYFGALWYFESSVDVERARYAVLSHPEMPLFAAEPAVEGVTKVDEVREDVRVRAWEASNLERVTTDRRMPGRAEVFAHVLVSTYETWEQVGAWWWNLVKDQLIVDAEIKDLVKQLTKGRKDDRDKVRAIHEWVVKNTRYVGIEFGVHGWKPYRTTMCLRRRFGDCKDKASLIKVMLNAAGIDANLVLIRTRRLGHVAQSPANLAVFNHAIAYVPKFDLYLDGTASFSGMNELPFSDQGQLSLIVADGGGVTVRVTPVDPVERNSMVRVLDVDLRPVDPLVTGEFVAKGADAVYYRRTFDTEEKRLENLEAMLARTYPGAKLKSAEFKSVTDINEDVTIKFVFEGGGFVKQSGDSRFLLPAGRHFRMLDAYAARASRDQDLMLGVPFGTSHRVTYHLPEGLRPKVLPEASSGSSKFGSFRIAREGGGDTIHFDVSYTSATERVENADYPGYRAWLAKMDRALNQPIVLESVLND